MQTHAAMTHARHGIYRIVRFIAWVMTIVTFLALIGHGFSNDTNFHTTLVLLAVLGMSVGVLLLLPSHLHLKYQKIIALTFLIIGIGVCLLL